MPNNLNPEFIKTIQIDYYFEREQCFRAIVSDSDQLEKDFISLSSANYIGDTLLSKNIQIEVNQIFSLYKNYLRWSKCSI